MKRTLNKTILFSFLGVILVMSVSMALLGFYVIKNNIIKRAQEQVMNNLKAAGTIYDNELEVIDKMFSILPEGYSAEESREKIGLDYLYKVKRAEKNTLKSEIAEEAFKGIGVKGTRVISKEELENMDIPPARKEPIEILFTPRARPLKIEKLTGVMAMEYARPVLDRDGEVEEVLYGGRIINRNFKLVDKIRELVFENKLYKGKSLGTVTIFQDDVRIATNVLNKNKERAVGTRVSEIVYKNVIEEGKWWVDRAFVVTDWRLTAYEPIKDIYGNIIGILYVGILEEPFLDMTRSISIVFLLIVIFSAGIAVFFSFILASQVSKPVRHLLSGINKVSRGELACHVKAFGSVKELDELAFSFNDMARKLHQSYEDIKFSNRELAALNQRYLELVSFVSHELKGILSSAILNAYSVRDGFLGMVNFKQQRALDSVSRNLDYLSATVRNFLSLSRLEKNEMILEKSEVKIKEDIFDPVLDDFSRQIIEKRMKVTFAAAPCLSVKADADLLRIAANNLLSNAVKYGREEGNIIVEAEEINEGIVRVKVYNDGNPIPENQKEKLFKRFSRLDTKETKQAKGTGLGLFITKEIIEKHNGTIEVQNEKEGISFIFCLKKEEENKLC
ncbi:MAG: cache domain-containing protein [Candidatus Omnitrophota bacterium]